MNWSLNWMTGLSCRFKCFSPQKRKDLNKKMPGHWPGNKRRNRIGDAGSYGPQKGRERAYAGLQRIHKKALQAIIKKLL